jgi:putative hydrolase of the HAD superfamily
MSIQAVFFDMGGTIETYCYTPQLRRERTPELQQRLVAAGIDLRLDNEGLYQLVSAGLRRYHAWSLETDEELPSERVWRDFIFPGYTLDQGSLSANAEDLMLHIETRYYERAMRPEIPQVLEAISRMGLKIALISNVNSRGQVPANLERYGIRHYFDCVVLSSEYGRRKPDPAIFHYGARLACLPTGACLYVGDRIARDVVGARRAGFGLAVQIQHDFEHGEDDSGAEPDFLIRDMRELLPILEQDAKRAAPPAPAGPLKALLFDAGDILYHRPQKADRLAAFLKESVVQVHEPSIEEREMLTGQAYRGQLNQDQYYEGLLRLYGITQPEQLLRGRQLLEEEDNQVVYFPGVKDTLIALEQSGYLLGIVTDTANSVHAKLRWFEKGGFGHVWDSIISSRELGRRKPDPAIYQAALDQLGVRPSEAAFVGHKASELDGAKAVGIHTIAFNYEPDVRADYFIEKFPDLLEAALLPRQEPVTRMGN